MAVEALQLGGMRAAIHSDCQRSPLEAVAAELAPPKAGSDSTGLHNKSRGLSRERLGTKAAEGEGLSRRRSSARTGQSSMSPSGSGTVTA